jgi:hypothetical protein
MGDVMRRWIPVMLVPLVAVAALAGCGSDSEDAGTETSTPGSTPVSSPTLPAPSGVEVAMVLEDVEYYGACGNEILDLDEGTFYPLTSDEVEALQEELYATLVGTPAAGTEPAGMIAAPRVAPPGPGDDVGTLVVYADGVARFESDSGQVRWLSDEVHEYNFVC